MIVDVARLTVWEWYKLRRRWMPYVLVSVAVLLTQLLMWLGYSAYHNETMQAVYSGGMSSFGYSVEVDGEFVELSVSCVDLVNGRMPENLHLLPENERQTFLADMERFRAESCAETNPRDELRAAFVMPDAVTGAVKGAIFVGPIFVGPILIMVLAVSSMGSEYGLGTLRTTLTRGAGRWQLMASRLVLLLFAAAAGLLVVAAAAVAGSVAAAVIPPGEDGGIADAGKWSDAAVMFGKAVYALAPYIALGVFLAVLTQSTGTGLAISLGYYVVELIVVPIIGNYERVEWIRDAVLGHNVTGWLQSAFVEVEVDLDAAEQTAANQPDTLQAFLVILAYVVVLGAAAFALFLRRDIAGARGG